ncbi:MAG: carbon-nitrogen hydrolase family protein [Methanobacterium sp.]|nr:carbon-nitrogen hydrolase family protein [Methanobacterium sp.]
MKDFKLAVCQMLVKDDKEANLEKAVNFIRISAAEGADLVVLPEMFNCPYENEKFPLYAEHREDSISLKTVSQAARECDVHLVAGSIPEVEGDKIYNTSFIFDSHGVMLGAHRKLHLFDVDVPGGISFKESDTLSPGDDVTILDTDLGKLGVVICYDIRFGELIRLMALEGVDFLIVPGAFNLTTGPAHWDTLIRSRAIENQFYVVGASPARDVDASYVAYGHSLVVDPWGEVLSRAGIGEEIIFADLEAIRIGDVREQMPLFDNRRTDLYSIKKVKR